MYSDRSAQEAARSVHSLFRAMTGHNGIVKRTYCGGKTKERFADKETGTGFAYAKLSDILRHDSHSLAGSG
jgi:hypothetical protein